MSCVLALALSAIYLLVSTRFFDFKLVRDLKADLIVHGLRGFRGCVDRQDFYESFDRGERLPRLSTSSRPTES